MSINDIMAKQKRFWEKLWHDILDDVKLGPLPGELKWRFVQLIVVAGELNEGGLLPELSDLAFRLRLTEEQLRSDLPTLARRELVELDANDRWHVVNYAKRQAAMTPAERMQRYRQRNRNSPAAAAALDNSYLQEEEYRAEAEAENVTPFVTKRYDPRYENVTNRNAAAVLQEFGVALNRTTRQLLTLDPKYIRAHLAAEPRTGLAITRMLAGDPPPQPKVNGRDPAQKIPDELKEIIKR